MAEDPLDPARGVIMGMMLSVPFWMILLLWLRQ